MASIIFNITGSDTALSTNVPSGSQLTMSIVNPLEGASYFTLQTIPNQNGFYDSSSPKNLSGSFELKSGIIGLVSDDYKMSAVVQRGSSELIFTPAINLIGSTIRVIGVGNPVIGDSSIGKALFDAYQNRVLSDGGVVEGEQCVINGLNNLNNIWVYTMMHPYY